MGKQVDLTINWIPTDIITLGLSRLEVNENEENPTLISAPE